MLTGSEVKSLRAGKANLVDAYAVFRGTELFLINCHISRYDPAAYNNHEPTRSRKLLLHAHELEKLLGKLKEKGLTLVPTKIYFNKEGKAKCELALGKGKQAHDKRASIKERETKRDLQRVVKR